MIAGDTFYYLIKNINQSTRIKKMSFSSVKSSRPSRARINTSESQVLEYSDGSIVRLHENVAKVHSASGKVHEWSEKYNLAEGQMRYIYKRYMEEPGFYEENLSKNRQQSNSRQRCKKILKSICELKGIEFNSLFSGMIGKLETKDVAEYILGYDDDDMSVETASSTISDNSTLVDCSTIGTNDSDISWVPYDDIRMMAQDSHGYMNVDEEVINDEDSSSDYEDEEIGLGF